MRERSCLNGNVSCPENCGRKFSGNIAEIIQKSPIHDRTGELLQNDEIVG